MVTEDERKQVVKERELWLDIGATDKQDASRRVRRVYTEPVNWRDPIVREEIAALLPPEKPLEPDRRGP